MIGILVILLLSWALLWLVEKNNLSVLGLKPTPKRILHLTVGFLLTALACAVYHYTTVAFIENNWTINNAFTLQTAANSSWFTFKSVLFEELIFRGVLLYLALKRFGLQKACLLSALCFGVYHWFSYGLFGNPIQMLIVLLMTGFVGYALALSFAKTRSLYLAVGLHLGWNLLNIVVFSNGPLGEQLLVKANSTKPDGLISLAVFLFQVLALPLVALGYTRYLSKK